MRWVWEHIHSFCPAQQFWGTPVYPLARQAQVWDALLTRSYYIIYPRYSSKPSRLQSPDGQRIAMSSETGQIYIFDLETGSLTTTFTSHAMSVRSLAWSPDSSVRYSLLPHGNHVFTITVLAPSERIRR